MNKIAIDIVGPLPETKDGNKYILTVYDPFSHWPSAYPIPNTTAEQVIVGLKRHIAIHSVPSVVLSDQGSNFVAKAVKEFLTELGARKVETTPYKPQSNGSVERFHAYLAQAISHATNETHTDWDRHIDSALFAYRTTPLDGIDVSPFQILYGREPNMPIDNLMEISYDRIPITPEQHIQMVNETQKVMYERVRQLRAERFQRNKKAVGIDRTIPEYKIGQKIYLKFPKGRFRPLRGATKLSPVNGGPYIVRAKLMDGLVYTVESEDMGYVQNVSVIRMIPAGLMTIPAEVADFPGRWQQWQLKDRVDRLNDEKEECKEMDHKEMEEEMTEHQVVRSRQADPLLHDSGMQPPPVRSTGTTPFFDRTIERKPQANPFQGRHSMEQAQAGAQRLIEQTSTSTQNFARQGQTIATPTHHTQAPTPSTATTQTNTATTQTPNTTMRNTASIPHTYHKARSSTVSAVNRGNIDNTTTAGARNESGPGTDTLGRSPSGQTQLHMGRRHAQMSQDDTSTSDSSERQRNEYLRSISSVVGKDTDVNQTAHQSTTPTAYQATTSTAHQATTHARRVRTKPKLQEPPQQVSLPLPTPSELQLPAAAAQLPVIKESTKTLPEKPDVRNAAAPDVPAGRTRSKFQAAAASSGMQDDNKQWDNGPEAEEDKEWQSGNCASEKECRYLYEEVGRRGQQATLRDMGRRSCSQTSST